MFGEIFSQNSGFSRFMNFLWNVIVISILWFVCSIPVITIGAASTAAYYAMAKVVRHHTGAVSTEFFSAFRRNFTQATIFTVGYILVIFLLLLDCSLLYSGGTEDSMTLLCLIVALILMVVAHTQYLFPVLSRFEQSLFGHFRMAFVFVFRHLLTSIMVLVLLCAVLACIYLIPLSLLFVPGLALYLQTFPMEKILRKYAPPASEEDADKWYNQ